MEGRWLKNADIYLNDYIRFLLNHAHEGTQYSSFTLWATKEFHAVTGKADIPAFLPKAKALYADFEREDGRRGHVDRRIRHARYALLVEQKGAERKRLAKRQRRL